MTKIHGTVYLFVGVLLIAAVRYFSRVRDDSSLNLFTYLAFFLIIVGVGKLGISAFRKKGSKPKISTQKPVPSASAGARYCSKCGTPQPGNADFCSQCGNSL